MQHVDINGLTAAETQARFKRLETLTYSAAVAATCVAFDGMGSPSESGDDILQRWKHGEFRDGTKECIIWAAVVAQVAEVELEAAVRYTTKQMAAFCQSQIDEVSHAPRNRAERRAAKRRR